MLSLIRKWFTCIKSCICCRLRVPRMHLRSARRMLGTAVSCPHFLFKQWGRKQWKGCSEGPLARPASISKQDISATVTGVSSQTLIIQKWFLICDNEGPILPIRSVGQQGGKEGEWGRERGSAVRGKPLLSFTQVHHPAEERSALTVADHLKSSSFKMCINFTPLVWNEGSSLGDAFDEPDLERILRPCAAEVIVNDELAVAF